MIYMRKYNKKIALFLVFILLNSFIMSNINIQKINAAPLLDNGNTNTFVNYKEWAENKIKNNIRNNKELVSLSYAVDEVNSRLILKANIDLEKLHKIMSLNYYFAYEWYCDGKRISELVDTSENADMSTWDTSGENTFTINELSGINNKKCACKVYYKYEKGDDFINYLYKLIYDRDKEIGVGENENPWNIWYRNSVNGTKYNGALTQGLSWEAQKQFDAKQCLEYYDGIKFTDEDSALGNIESFFMAFTLSSEFYTKYPVSSDNPEYNNTTLYPTSEKEFNYYQALEYIYILFTGRSFSDGSVSQGEKDAYFLKSPWAKSSYISWLNKRGLSHNPSTWCMWVSLSMAGSEEYETYKLKYGDIITNVSLSKFGYVGDNFPDTNMNINTETTQTVEYYLQSSDGTENTPYATYSENIAIGDTFTIPLLSELKDKTVPDGYEVVPFTRMVKVNGTKTYKVYYKTRYFPQTVNFYKYKNNTWVLMNSYTEDIEYNKDFTLYLAYADDNADNMANMDGTYDNSSNIGYIKQEGYSNITTGVGNITNTTYKVTDSNELAVYYNPITYSVVFNGNEATYGDMDPLKLQFDIISKLTQNKYQRTYNVDYSCFKIKTFSTSLVNTQADAKFLGWATKTDSAVIYKDASDVLNLLTQNNAKYNLYAKWDLGSVVLPTPTMDGYTFLGWYEDSALTKYAGKGGDKYIPNSDITLYEKWEPITPIIVAPQEITFYQGEDVTADVLWNKITIKNAYNKWITGDNIKIDENNNTYFITTDIMEENKSYLTYNVKFYVQSLINQNGTYAEASASVIIKVLKVSPIINIHNNLSYYEGENYLISQTYQKPDDIISIVKLQQLIDDGIISAYGCDKNNTKLTSLTWCNKDLTSSVFIEKAEYYDEYNKNIKNVDNPLSIDTSKKGIVKVTLCVENGLKNKTRIVFNINIKENVAPNVMTEDIFAFKGEAINGDYIKDSISASDVEENVDLLSYIDGNVISRVESQITKDNFSVKQIIKNMVNTLVICDGVDVDSNVIIPNYAAYSKIIDLYNQYQLNEQKKLYLINEKYYNWYGFDENGVYLNIANKSLLNPSSDKYILKYSQVGFDDIGLKTNISSDKEIEKNIKLFVRDSYGKVTTAYCKLTIVSPVPEEKSIRQVNSEFLDSVINNTTSKWSIDESLREKLTNTINKEATDENSISIWELSSEDIKKMKKEEYQYSTDINGFLNDFKDNKTK